MAAGNPLNEELKQEILSIDGVTDIIPSRQSLYATLKTDIYQSGGMCDMLTDQNYATVEAALTAGTMPKDSRSIVIDYNVLKQNEDMGVGSTVDFYLERGNRLFPSLYQDCLIPTRRLPGMENWPSMEYSFSHQKHCSMNCTRKSLLSTIHGAL